MCTCMYTYTYCDTHTDIVSTFGRLPFDNTLHISFSIFALFGRTHHAP